MVTNDQFSTLGVVLIKCTERHRTEKSSAGAKSNNEMLKQFLLGIPSKQKKKACTGCNKVGSRKPCSNYQVMLVSSVAGFFDYLVAVKAKDIESIEGFASDCLRLKTKGHPRRTLISETQTVAGYIHEQFV